MTASGPTGSVLDLIGGTPLVPLERIGRGLPNPLYGKLEFLNPGGSVKDRIAPFMLDAAERDGRLRPGGTIVEATSGNTGVGLAMVAAVRGYRTILVVPDKMSPEKIRLLQAFGARVVLTPASVPPDDPSSHYAVARRIAAETPNAYYPNQYENPGNPEAHYRTTGPEIDDAVGPSLGAVVLSIGTGGTVSGVGRYFKEHRPSVRIVAVDPEGSVLAPYFRTGACPPAVPWKVEGIGEDLVPKTVDVRAIDEFVTVSDAESFRWARRLAREEGLFAGGSSGAALAGAARWVATARLAPDQRVVVLLPDSGDRYLTKFYDDGWMRENGFEALPATAGAVLGARAPSPTALATPSTATVREVLLRLRLLGLDRLPLLDGGRPVGGVGEEELLRAVAADASALDRPVGSVAGPAWPEVEATATLAEVVRRLRDAPGVLVRAGGRPIGVLTLRDLRAFLVPPGGGGRGAV